MNDFEYMKKKFEEDGVRAPETLSEEKIREMIADEPQTGTTETAGTEQAPKKKYGRRIAAIVAAAACVAVLVMTPQIRDLMKPGAGPEDAAQVESEETVAVGDLQEFKSYDEIKDLIKEMQPDMPVLYGGGIMREDADMAMATEEAESATGAVPNAAGGAAPKAASGAAGESTQAVTDGASAAAPGAAASGEHSDTYVQVEGVDEADIIKTDGKYIYHVTGEGEVRIFSAANGKTKAVATISQFEKDGWIQNMFLSGDRLITVGSVWDEKEDKSAVTTYDISDPKDPKQVHQFQQSGHVVSSRLTGGFVYLVTTDYVGYTKRVVPYVTCDGDYSKMALEDIRCFPDPKSPSYVVVSAIDISSGENAKAKSKAVLGASDDIYCNTENLYIAGATYQSSGNQMVTRLLKVALNIGKPKFTATGKVRGYIDNQFSMDEKDGYFRIATTSDRNGKDVNNLFVLDEKLEMVGEVTGFARNEHIEAVRYIGDKAYVITYETTDPLFIIDLSDPKSPEIEGEVKITGFSTLLVPMDKDNLLGIGYATEENEWGEAVDGVKLVIFDISDPSKPKVKDSKSFRGFESQAQYDHHALLTGLPDGGYAIPYSRWIEKTDEYSGGVLTFKAKDEIEVTNKFKVEDEGISRCIRIDGWIYALDENDAFHGFELK